MRICLIYDCLFPLTIGGAERWYRNLGERLAAEGNEITYLTLLQWDTPPEIPGVKVIAVGPRLALYHDGKRRIFPPLRFGFGVFFHLLRHGKNYDVVHTASFPYFSLLAAAVVRRRSGYRINCDWHEVWSKRYWREYLGVLGILGSLVQHACARVPQTAYTFSKLHLSRLNALGTTNVRRLHGQFLPDSPFEFDDIARTPLTVVYAGRFIPEKRVDLLVDALLLAKRIFPDLEAQLIGDGPTRPSILARIQSLGADSFINCPGFVETDAIHSAMRSALCVVQPSEREGYGMVVVEAAYRGVPAVVIAGRDNASTELISEAVNGFVVGHADPELLKSAIVNCIDQGAELRSTTRAWYTSNSKNLSLQNSLDVVVENYRIGMASN